MGQNGFYVHPSSIVDTTTIGTGTTIWAFVHIMPNVLIGANCNICDHCFIESRVKIGDNVTLKSGIYIWSGVEIDNNVFLGPNVVFTNDLRPRSKNKNYQLTPTFLREGASIGANSTILAGITIGRYAMTGIGSVVTRDVKDYALVYGNPAKQYGWVDEIGEKLSANEEGEWRSADGKRSYRETEAGLILV
ncbi:acyltransferase [Hymenobacter aerophilus]|uniref:acyltransferase n=1 Tax=Hymenobacter aerophilus TaxID=119644 RepID=UPI0008FBEA54|nr:acyltransferase [Hymenobacter aerophilus]